MDGCRVKTKIIWLFPGAPPGPPIGPTPARLPVGIDFTGRPYAEPMLVKIAGAYTAANPSSFAAAGVWSAEWRSVASGLGKTGQDAESFDSDRHRLAGLQGHPRIRDEVLDSAEPLYVAA